MPFEGVSLLKPVKCKGQHWRTAQSSSDAGIVALFSLQGDCKNSKIATIVAASVVGGLLLIALVATVLLVVMKPHLPKSLFRRVRPQRGNVYIINA